MTTVFEISWEVCNKIGGIYTVLQSKAARCVEQYGEQYWTIGPLITNEYDEISEFEDDPSMKHWVQSCQEIGIPVRIGHWLVPGRPRCILVGFSGEFSKRDAILATMWEDYHIDSLTGGWDYIEPVLFSHTVGRVLEHLWSTYLCHSQRDPVVHSHEWMTAPAALYLKKQAPDFATVFTTHATILGRSLTSAGQNPTAPEIVRDPSVYAEQMGIRAKFSMESIAAQQVDVFATVSDHTAHEAKLLLGRAPDLTTPNGMNVEFYGELAGNHAAAIARQKLRRVAELCYGPLPDDPFFIAISGRYEFKNKGIDRFLKALATLKEKGANSRPVVAFALIPGGHIGLEPELHHRLDPKWSPNPGVEPIFCTHRLNDPDRDPIINSIRELGLDRPSFENLRFIQVPEYVSAQDALFQCSYETLLHGFDYTCFPSRYEPWGYTPAESLAAGVPTLTTRDAGIGQWAQSHDLRPSDGIEVLYSKDNHPESAIAAQLDQAIANAINYSDANLRQACLKSAKRLTWEQLYGNYVEIYRLASQKAEARSQNASRIHKSPATITNITPVLATSTPPPAPHLIDITPHMPENLRGLERLTKNYWWSWNEIGERAFRSLNPEAWHASRRDPSRFLASLDYSQLESRSQDAGYMEQLQAAVQAFDKECGTLHGPGTVVDPETAPTQGPIYICTEFAIHESLRIYSGGLGGLAGDHLKSASDLNVPLTAIGLMYRGGYFIQTIDPDGNQVASSADNDPARLPLTPITDATTGQPHLLKIMLPDRDLHIRAWRADIGRVPLYLLDTDVPENQPSDRGITHQLYVGDRQTRMLQEMVLGIGGSRLLKALNFTPSSIHLNEGHSAFFMLEYATQLIRQNKLSFDEARLYLRSITAFSTHTPVDPGHERFDEAIVRPYFSRVAERLGLSWEQFMSMAHAVGHDGVFDMTRLANFFSGHCNSVSKLHRLVSQRILADAFPGYLQQEIPIDAITNGVHLPTWVDESYCELIQGSALQRIEATDFQDKAQELSDKAIWQVRHKAHQTMVEHLRTIVEEQAIQRRCTPRIISKILQGLRDDALFIGFARRFATYKRAHLLLRDRDRLKRLLNNSDRPVRVVFAGLAHPNDGAGRDLLRSLVQMSHEPDFAGRLFFLSGYGLHLARLLTRGVDLWLNTPIRGLEASGTSGMKAVANGTLNLSVNDGWWDEAYSDQNGWTIMSADSTEGDDHEFRNELDAASVYRLLEDHIIPDFFDRDEEGLPKAWVGRMRNALQTLPPVFNSNRMVQQYNDMYYEPAGRRHEELIAQNYQGVRSRNERHRQLRKDFEALRVISAEVPPQAAHSIEEQIPVRVELAGGGYNPEDLQVQVLFGPVNGSGFKDLKDKELEFQGAQSDGRLVYAGSFRPNRSGHFGYHIRVRPKQNDNLDSVLAPLVLWA